MNRSIETQRIADLAAMMANGSPARGLEARLQEARRLVEAAAEGLAVGSWSEWLEGITRSLVAHEVPRDVAENHVQAEFGGVVEHRPTLKEAAQEKKRGGGMNTQEWRRLTSAAPHGPPTAALHEQITRLERNLAALQAAMGQAQQEVVQRVREIHQRDQELLRLRQQIQAILRGETDSLLALLHESEERGHALARQVAHQRQGMAMAMRLLRQHAESQALDLLQGMIEGQ